MKKTKIREPKLEDCSLSELCSLIGSYEVPFEDVADFVENKTYAYCTNGHYELAVLELTKLARFFEEMPGKNDENCRDLADIYILIGEICQYVNKFEESIEWFKKAAVVADRYAVPYHNLATAYIELGDAASAIRSLEQEILLEPGNYFSALRLADLYEQQGYNEKAELCLERILERNPENIKALHRLITHYQEKHPEAGVELLRRRLLGITKEFNEIEIVIRTFHLCEESRFADALEFIAVEFKKSPAMTMLHLLKAHVLGETHQFAMKRRELIEFKKNCFGKMKFIENKLEEFEHIFGEKAVGRLEKILMISRVHSAH
jgi:tetratricopeptide (TPR) repeat protein